MKCTRKLYSHTWNPPDGWTDRWDHFANVLKENFLLIQTKLYMLISCLKTVFLWFYSQD